MRRRLGGPRYNYAVDKKNGVDGVKYFIKVLVDSVSDTPAKMATELETVFGAHLIPCKILSVSLETEKKGVDK